jgi:hypothetical protein
MRGVPSKEATAFRIRTVLATRKQTTPVSRPVGTVVDTTPTPQRDDLALSQPMKMISDQRQAIRVELQRTVINNHKELSGITWTD